MRCTADNTASQQRGRPFKRGQSGNPAGRPKGARNTTTLAIEALLDGEAQMLTRKAIELAKNGDIAALRLCMDRILPTRRDRPVMFDLTPIEGPKDAAKTISVMLAAVASGELNPTDAVEVCKLVDSYIRAFEATELTERVEQLEKMARS
jgi:hypothetical protein